MLCFKGWWILPIKVLTFWLLYCTCSPKLFKLSMVVYLQKESNVQCKHQCSCFEKKDLLSNGRFTESLFLVTTPIWLTLRKASQIYWPASGVLREGKFSDDDLIVSDTVISTGDTLIVLLADLLVQVITGDTMSLSTTDTVQFNMYCSPGWAKPTVNIFTIGIGVAVWRKERERAMQHIINT